MSGRRELPVAAPALVGRELEYVTDCVESTWISSTGSYIERFERAFGDFCGVEHAISCCNGTVALHLALLGLGVGPGDEVIVPDAHLRRDARTPSATAARTPVLVDSEEETWNLDPERLARADHAADEGRSSPSTCTGTPSISTRCSSSPSCAGCSSSRTRPRRTARAIRAAASAPSATVRLFSFYGNKIITTGEGGMVVTNDAELAARVRQLRGQGQDPGAPLLVPDRRLQLPAYQRRGGDRARPGRADRLASRAPARGRRLVPRAPR